MADDKKGMLRHVDVLGRVVIPREVRKALRINYGDLMEFCACSNQQVVMRKFHLIREIAELANSVVRVARLGRNCDIYILDTEKVVSKNGENLQSESDITEDILKVLNSRQEVEINERISLAKYINFDNPIIIVPVISAGDVLGGVVVSAHILDEEMKQSAREISKFLGDYFAS
ncbi:MAG: hypothetical protein IJ301_04220 [Clostridia bacterium]|nr:hypothetical protein [Clostridia bacterium]